MADQRDREQEPRHNLESLYERMSRAFRDNLERYGALTEETMERALEETRDWARQLREYYNEDVPRVSEFLRRDIQEAVRQARQQTRRSLDFNRIGAGVMGFVQRMAKNAGSRLDAIASRLDERLTYKTGEVAGPGTLTCARCEQVLVFEHPRRIPPCPRCHSTAFRRSY